MKKFFLVLVVFGVIFATSSLLLSCSGGSGHKHQGQKEEVKAKVVYTCPMHPEVVSDKPGECPKCGMNLEPKKTERKVKFFEESEYTCSCCPDVKESKPGKCPKCGMRLEKSATKMFSHVCPVKKCEYKSMDAGKCPKHKKELKKTEVKLYCPMDNTELQTKDGKLFCPKCKKEIKPEDVKIKKIEKKK